MVNLRLNTEKNYILTLDFFTAGLLMASYFTIPFLKATFRDSATVQIKIKPSDLGLSSVSFRTLGIGLRNHTKNNPLLKFKYDQFTNRIILQFELDYVVVIQYGINQLCLETDLVGLTSQDFCYSSNIDLADISQDVEKFLNSEIHRAGAKSIEALKTNIDNLPSSLFNSSIKNVLLGKIDDLKNTINTIDVEININDEKVNHIINQVNTGLRVSVAIIFSLIILFGIGSIFGLEKKYKIIYHIFSWLVLLLLISISIAIIIISQKRDLIVKDPRVSIGLGLSSYLFFSGTALYLLLKLSPLQIISKKIAKIIERNL